MNFVIYAPSYREDSGGIILLHKLCHLLNEMGYKAYLCPDRNKIKPGFKNSIDNLFRVVKYKTFPKYISPIATSAVLQEEFVAVYPETVEGNPLNCKNVVRWLLHKPGYHTGVVNYSSGELMFVFDQNCIEPGYGIDPKNELSFLSMHSAYNSNGINRRSGSCYMMRKGKGRTLVHNSCDSIKIDDLDHEEVAEIFKKTRYFYSYDEFTLYSQYAALCGCISVVIPETYNSRKEWVEKHPISKYGIAYGLNDTKHAVETQHEVLKYFENVEEDSLQAIQRFVDKVGLHFQLS